MSLFPPFPIELVENEAFSSLVMTYYPVVNGSPFDFTGYSASWVFRTSVSAAGTISTFTPTLGGTAGTITLPKLTAAQVSTILSALNYGTGVHGVVLTSPGGDPVQLFTDPSVVSCRRVAAR